ncbi:hypothetical protein WBG78_26655 [Chryseolinea sp. T2]|uniref:hypothetical protein n=1 Tax=Chryseolinea sp. T2 TaxID=3129255 RepID=UPI0030785385
MLEFRPSLLAITLFIITNACDKKESDLLVKKDEIVAKEEYCEIVSSYPIIYPGNKDTTINSLNRKLKNINHLDQSTKYCNRANETRKRIKIQGTYSVLFESKNLLCLEYLTTVEGIDVKRFTPLFIDLNEKRITSDRKAFPIPDSRVLVPYITSFCDSSKIQINLSVYENNKTFAMSYGITPDDLILYLGGEGEGFGYHKLSIPLKELGLSTLF